MRVILVLVATITAAGGCVSYRHAVAAGFETRLVDAATGAPVSGAQVVLSTTRTDRVETVSAVSSPDGLVKIGPIERDKWLPLLPITIYPLPGVVSITAAGYRRVEGIETLPSSSDPKSTYPDVLVDKRLAEIRLEPEQ
jgi:hypothetical protein